MHISTRIIGRLLKAAIVLTQDRVRVISKVTSVGKRFFSCVYAGREEDVSFLSAAFSSLLK